jgi:hypothetical protein
MRARGAGGSPVSRDGDPTCVVARGSWPSSGTMRVRASVTGSHSRTRACRFRLRVPKAAPRYGPSRKTSTRSRRTGRPAVPSKARGLCSPRASRIGWAGIRPSFARGLDPGPRTTRDWLSFQIVGFLKRAQDALDGSTREAEALLVPKLYWSTSALGDRQPGNRKVGDTIREEKS